MEESRFILQLYRVGTPRGAEGIFLGWSFPLEGVAGPESGLSLSVCPKLKNPKDIVARGLASDTTSSAFFMAALRFFSASCLFASAAFCFSPTVLLGTR
jgi:hypothetical protein